MIHVKTNTIHVTKTSETKDNIYFRSGEQHPENPNRRRETPQSGLRGGGCRSGLGGRGSSQRRFGGGDGGGGLLLVLVVAIGVDGLGADDWGGETRGVRSGGEAHERSGHACTSCRGEGTSGANEVEEAEELA